jgi:hypothetical protein
LDFELLWYNETDDYGFAAMHKNSGQDINMKIVDRSFEKEEIYKYLCTTCQSLNHWEIESRLNAGNVCLFVCCAEK